MRVQRDVSNLKRLIRALSSSITQLSHSSRLDLYDRWRRQRLRQAHRHKSIERLMSAPHSHRSLPQCSAEHAFYSERNETNRIETKRSVGNGTGTGHEHCSRVQRSINASQNSLLCTRSPSPSPSPSPLRSRLVFGFALGGSGARRDRTAQSVARHESPVRYTSVH